VRQLLTESLVLSLIGGELGLLFANWGSRALFSLASRATDFDLGLDLRVLAYTFGITVVTGVLFGLAPALRAARVSPSETLKTQGRVVIGEGDSGGRWFSFGKLLLASQMALCLLLLIVAGLFARSLQALAQIDLGFDRDHLLVARLDPRAAGYGAQDLTALYRRILERVSNTPGVIAASLSRNGALSGGTNSSSMSVEGYTPRQGERMSLLEEAVTADYFRTHSIRLVKGRAFDAHDAAGSRRLSIINETMARTYFSGRDPIGRRWGNGSNMDNASEIVGVAADVHHVDLRADIKPFAYSLVVEGKPTDADASTSVQFLTSIEVRTAGSPAAMAETLRRVLRDAEPRLPVIEIGTMSQRVERMSRQEQLVAY